MHVLDSTADKVIWMKKLVPRFSSHLGLRVTEIKLTATDNIRTTKCCGYCCNLVIIRQQLRLSRITRLF